MKTRILLLIVLGIFIGVGAGCSGPPTTELMQAEAAIQAAQADGADDYVPEEYKAAAEALADAKSKTESKDYNAAREAALMARKKADEAKSKVGPEKLKMRGEIETIMPMLTDEWTALMDTSMKKRVNQETRAALDSTRETFTQLVADIQHKKDAEDYVGAMESMKEARKKTAEVKTMLEDQ